MQIYEAHKLQTVTRCRCPQQNKCVFSNQRNSRKVCSESCRWRGRLEQDAVQQQWMSDHPDLCFIIALHCWSIHFTLYMMFHLNA